MPGIRVSHEWQAKAREVDFLRNNGGFYAVSLTLTTEDAQRLANNIRACLKNAKRHERENVEIVAPWGRKTKGSDDAQRGYRLRTRIKL